MDILTYALRLKPKDKNYQIVNDFLLGKVGLRYPNTGSDSGQCGQVILYKFVFIWFLL